MPKVMLVNGSPHKDGCINRALDEMETTFAEEGIEVGRFWVGTKPIAGCIACGYCAKHNGRCVFNDIVNRFNEIAGEYDGFVFGSAVHYAAATGSITSFMDRSFYSQAMGGLDLYRRKPAAAVTSARRAGNTSTFDQLNKYFSILEMPIISSSYWNMVYGSNAQEVEQDAEGLRTMRVLAHNMTYFLRCIEAGAALGVPAPVQEEPARTNFIR